MLAVNLPDETHQALKTLALIWRVPLWRTLHRVTADAVAALPADARELFDTLLAAHARAMGNDDG
jgi:hypothetical protein